MNENYKTNFFITDQFIFQEKKLESNPLTLDKLFRYTKLDLG